MSGSGERQEPDAGKAVEHDSRPAEYAPPGARGDDPLTRNLKRVYADIAAEPIPDQLLALLQRLGAVEQPSDEIPKEKK